MNTQSNSRLLTSMAVVVCISLVTNGVIAQDVTRMEVSGTIIGIDLPGIVRIRDEAGKIVLADVTSTRRLPNGGFVEIPPPAFSIVGQKSIDVLKPGQFVRFEAVVERQRRIEEEVKSLTLFAQTPFTELGFLEPRIDIADPELEKKLLEQEKAREDKDRRRYVVAGTISKLQNGRMTIRVPDADNDVQKISVIISKDAIVNLELLDFRLAALGNRIQASGESMLPGHFFATKVQVTLDPDHRLQEIMEKQKLAANLEEKKKLLIGENPGEAKKDLFADFPKAEPTGEKVAVKENEAPREEGVFEPPAPFKYVPPEQTKSRRKRGLVGRVIKIN